MSKILVTGGAGFIGSHTVVELLNADYDVIVVDNFCNSSPAALERIAEICGRAPAFAEVDIRDREGLRRVFSAHEIEAVIHFAGLKAVGESVEKPLRYYQNNVAGTRDSLRSHGRGRRQEPGLQLLRHGLRCAGAVAAA